MEEQEFYYHKCLIDIIRQIKTNVSVSIILSQIEKVKSKLQEEGNTGISILIDSFLDALHTRVSSNHQDNQHLYLKTFETPQIILFETLIQNFPPVAKTQKTITTFIAQQVDSKKKVTIFDVGIGTGQQVVSIINEIKRTNSEIEEITIIGVEPSLDSIKIAKKNIKSCTSKLLKVNVILFHEFAEEMDITAIKEHIPKTSECFIINASFALHHIKTIDDRQILLQKLRTLGSNFLLLTEPNVDHYTPDLIQRFENCFRHFKVNFEIIDEQQLTTIEKEGLKHFFCREIKDIIGNTERNRVEKHSPVEEWVNLLKKANFNPITIPTERTLTKDFKWHKEGYLGFGTNKETLVGIVVVR